jgi:hypothetical protein
MGLVTSAGKVSNASAWFWNFSTRKYLYSHYYNVEKFHRQHRVSVTLSGMAKRLLYRKLLWITDLRSFVVDGPRADPIHCRVAVREHSIPAGEKAMLLASIPSLEREAS